ncbi:MAG: 23S rRNA (guanosine(2251)-2'-O)-methyltransferase RlmB [Hyphomicrobiaceae bacterium]
MSENRPPKTDARPSPKKAALKKAGSGKSDHKPAWQRDKKGGSKDGWRKSGSKAGGAKTGKVSGPTNPDHVWIYGLHAVSAALENAKRIPHALTLTENAARRLGARIEGDLPSHTIVRPKDLDKILGADTVHQGALLETSQLPEPSLEDLTEAAHAGPIVLLDQITDPHNVGAILRSAAVFGAAGVIMTWRHSPPLDATLAKSASGALELIPILRVQNLARTMDEIKSQGIAVIGLEGSAEAKLEDQAFSEPTAIVLGAEGKGLRQLTAQNCSLMCRIAASGALASLNVSNAAAVALHLASMRRA